MAWTESHQELRGHPKTKKFARLLAVDRPAAVGWLHFLWWWAMDYAEDGDLNRYEDADIEDGLDWPGDPGQLVAALTESGFIDENRCIHDWSEYGGKLVTARAAERERSRNRRLSNVRPADDQRTTVGQPADDHPASIGRGEEMRLEEKTGEETREDVTAIAEAPAAHDGKDDKPAEKPWTYSLGDLTEPAREFMESFRAAYGKKKPPNLNPSQIKALEEAVLDLGVERLTESADWAAKHGVEWGGGGVIKAINGARTKRVKDEEREIGPEHRNGHLVPDANAPPIVDVSEWGDNDPAWVKALLKLDERLSHGNVETLFDPIKAKLHGSTLVLAVPRDTYEQVVSRFGDFVKRALDDTGNGKLRVQFVIAAPQLAGVT